MPNEEGVKNFVKFTRKRSYQSYLKKKSHTDKKPRSRVKNNDSERYRKIKKDHWEKKFVIPLQPADLVSFFTEESRFALISFQTKINPLDDTKLS